MKTTPIIHLEDEDVLVDASFNDSLDNLDSEIALSDEKIDTLIEKFDKYQVHCDKFDYIVAAASGVLTGTLDAIFLKNINLGTCQDIGQSDLEPLVKRMGKSNDLKKAIRNLEQESKKGFASDVNLNDFGGASYHHLFDFAHHPTIGGLFFSILTQLTGKCYGTNSSGKFLIFDVLDKQRIGKTIGQKLSNGILSWFYHLASDALGTSRTIGRGTGIPGPILSLAKELSSVLPKGNHSALISKIYNGTIFEDLDEHGKPIPGTQKPFDFRTEIGLVEKQSWPVILNMVFVRIFYFIRKLVIELKMKKENSVYKINWKATFPFANTTIKRMNTISSLVFSSIDVGAAIGVAAAKSGGAFPYFIANLIININIVGTARLTLDLGSEVFTAIKRTKTRNEITQELNINLNLKCAKIYSLQENIWKDISKTEQLLDEIEVYKNLSFFELEKQIVNNNNNCNLIGKEIEDDNELKKIFEEELEF